MRILFVGDTGIKSRGALYYDVGTRLCNGFTRISNLHTVYAFSDRDTARAGNFLRSQSFGVGYCNEAFIDVCKNYRPDLIVFSAADLLKNESIVEVKKILPDAKMIQIIIDPLFCQGIVDKTRNKLPYMDATFANTAGRILGTISPFPWIDPWVIRGVTSGTIRRTMCFGLFG